SAWPVQATLEEIKISRVDVSISWLAVRLICAYAGKPRGGSDEVHHADLSGHRARATGCAPRGGAEEGLCRLPRDQSDAGRHPRTADGPPPERDHSARRRRQDSDDGRAVRRN